MKCTFFQPYCTPTASSCVADVSKQDLGCKVSCTGLYADKEHSDLTLYADRVLYQRMKEILTLAERGLELQKITPLRVFISVFSAVREIPDDQTREKVQEHIANYSTHATFPHLSSLPEEGRVMLESLMVDYVIGHKISYAKNLVFDPASSDLSGHFQITRLNHYDLASVRYQLEVPRSKSDSDLLRHGYL